MLALENVQKNFGSFSAVRGVDLAVNKGLIFGLLEPNGAGNTTLLRMIMGLILSTSGKIALFDSFAPTAIDVRSRIGCLPQ